jgi:hypothetical protein
MARWALAKQYGKDIAYTGPIYSGHTIEGNKVTVAFESESLFGGLMVGSKGSIREAREPGKYVEPARPTPGEKLNHFRLCGADKKWRAAEATIVGDTVVVTSPHVPKPVGVQYAYNAAPEGANLYNKAGLPATPFAQIDGKFIFEEDNPAIAAALKAKYARYTDPDYPILQIAEYYPRRRDLAAWPAHPCLGPHQRRRDGNRHPRRRHAIRQAQRVPAMVGDVPRATSRRRANHADGEIDPRL